MVIITSSSYSPSVLSVLVVSKDWSADMSRSSVTLSDVELRPLIVATAHFIEAQLLSPPSASLKSLRPSPPLRGAVVSDSVYCVPLSCVPEGSERLHGGSAAWL